MHIQDSEHKKINSSYNFVKRVYSLENRYNLILDIILSLSIILFFWDIIFFIQKGFIFTKVEFIILLIFPLFSFLLIHKKRITLDSIGRRLESLLPLEGRLFLSIDAGKGKKIYGAPELIKRTINDSDSILTPLKPSDFIKWRKHYLYYSIFAISIIFLLFSSPHLPPNIKITSIYIPGYKIPNHPSLITAYSNTPKLYVISGKKYYRMEKIGKASFGIYTIIPARRFYIGYRKWKKGPFDIPSTSNFKILAMKKHYKFPKYIKIPDIIDTTLQTEITAIQGTRIDFSIKVSPLPYKAYILKKSKKIPLHIHKQSILGKFVIHNKTNLEIYVSDSLKVPSSLISFLVFPVKDNPPKFSFISPETPYKLGKDMQLLLKCKIEDDFSLKNAFLKIGNRENKIYGVKGRTSVLSTAHFDLSNMLPGDTLKIYGIAEDAIGQKYISPPFIVYLPHLEQMLSSISEIGKTLADKTGEAIESQEELKKMVEDIIDKGTKNWEDKENLKNTLQEQKKLLDKISRIKDIMETFKNPEIQKEMEKIKELYQEMDIQKLNQEIQNAIKEGMKEKSLEKIDLSQEELLKALKMGKQLLEKLVKLMKIDEYYQSLTNIRKEQEKIVNAAEKNPKGESKTQSELANRMNALLKDMKSSQYKEIKNTGKTGEKKNIPENMQKLSKDFAKGNNNKRLSQKINEDINSLIKMLENAQKKEIMQKNLVSEFKKLIFGLRLVLNEIDKINEDPYLKDGIIDALTHIYNRATRLFLKSMAFSPKVLSDLSEVINSIKGNERVEPVKYKIENIILTLLEAGRKGKSSLLSELANMLQRQQGIGEKMQALIPMPAPQQAGGLRKIAGQERALAKRMGKLGDAFSSIAKEMEKLANKLEKGELTNKEIQMHKKILKHLLEAERSVRRRSFAKKRRSSPGKYYPPPVIHTTQDKGEKYYYERLMIEKFRDEPVSDAFKKAVKEYYERLLK